MKKSNLIILFLGFSLIVFSQEKPSKKLEREARKDVREGNELYNQLKFGEAEIAYKKALSKNPNYPKASYNLGNAIYQQNRNKEAVAQYELVEKTTKDKPSKAEAYHNLGNTFMKDKQYEKAVDAYKNSMRNNSKDDETRYNLAMAQELLKQQQKNKDNKDNKDDKKDKKDDKNKDQKDKEGGDKNKKEDKKDNKDKGKDKKDDKGDEKKKDQDKNENQPPKPNQMSPEQMKQLLEAMNNEENKTQKKLNAQKAKGEKIKKEKDW